MVKTIMARMVLPAGCIMNRTMEAWRGTCTFTGTLLPSSHGRGADAHKLEIEPWRGLQAAASRFVSMPVVGNATKINSVETILDAADTECPRHNPGCRKSDLLHARLVGFTT